MEREKVDTRAISVFGGLVLAIVSGMIVFDVYYYNDTHGPKLRKIPTQTSTMDDINRRMDSIESKLDSISIKLNK